MARFIAARSAPYHLWRLAEGAQERAPHPFAIAKAGIARHHFNGMQARLEHQTRCLDAQMLDRLCRRLARLRPERTAELPWTSMGRFRKLLDRQFGMKILFRIGERHLNAVGARLQFEQC
jgi:hypothetical protein